MKKLIVGMFVAGLVSMSSLISNQAEAYFLPGPDEVGELDPLVASISADDFDIFVDDYAGGTGGGGTANETLWANFVLPGDEVFYSYKLEEGDGVGGGYFEVTNDPDIYAGSLGDGNDPDYFLLKFGGNDGDLVRVLYENVDELDWAVVVLGDSEGTAFQLADGSYLTFDMLQSVSHITAFVPEPTTMLLFGSSLVGLMLYGRRKSRKETDKTS